LTGRRALVQISEDEKVSKKLTQSCPQGSSTTAPWAWNVVLNDLFVEIRKYGIQMQAFADDLVIYAIKDKHQKADVVLRRTMKCLANWSAKWKIELSKDKTKVMHFTHLRAPTKEKLMFDGIELEYVEKYKYLGIIFDSKLS
jgi:hypothetical protein